MQLQLGNLLLGEGAPIRIQSMCNTPTESVELTCEQINRLVESGCEIIRVAVPHERAALALRELVSVTAIPLIADIHFDPQLAMMAIASGVAGIRLNPGNLPAQSLERLAKMAIEHQTVIRVGSNSGSVRANLLKKYQALYPHDSRLAMAETLVESTLEQLCLLEKWGVKKMKVSLKASDVRTTLLACELFAQKSDYLQHIGVTEAGTLRRGVVKSSIGIGTLLLKNIGATIRVSLTADPVEEVKTAIAILEAIGLRDATPEIVSCPTCGRCQVNLQELAEKVDDLVEKIKRSDATIHLKKIAVMGCAVNGPGEARNADLALCGATENRVMLCEKGKAIGIYSSDEAFQYFKEKLMKGTVE